MEDILAVYTRPHDLDRPLVCLDKTSEQLVAETRAPIPMKAGRPARSNNGLHLTDPRRPGSAVQAIRQAMADGETFRAHAFEYACAQNDIDHRLTKPKHPWTNGQVERMNRTLKEATVKRYYYTTHDQLRRHLDDFVTAYNFARRLKTLRGLTPYEAICKSGTKEPDRFIPNPLHQMPGLNI